MKQAPQTKKRKQGISIWPLLLGAAAAGIVAGVVLSLTRQGSSEEEMMDQGETVADLTIPSGAPIQPPVDMMAPDPMSLRGIPPYPNLSIPPRKISRTPTGSAEVNAISWFTTDDSVDRVLTFYEEAYAGANIMHTSHRFEDKRGYVAWFEKRANPDGGSPEFGDGVLHMIFASQEGGSTTVLLSANEPYRMLQRASSLPGGVHLPDGARPQVLNLGEPGADHFTIFAEYEGKTPDQLASEVLEGMRTGGWSVSDSATSPEGKTTIVAALNSHVQIAVIEGTLEGAQVLVTLEQRSTAKRGTNP